MNNPASVEEYMASVPPVARETLENLRRTIRAAAPDAVESISYGMPTFKYRGKPLAYFAAAKNHCALYGTSEGTIRFPPDEPLTHDRVTALIAARMESIDAGTK